MTLVARILEVDDLLERGGYPHAFGGALALAYITEPRSTIDIDVNVFTPLDEIDPVLDLFAGIGLAPEADPNEWLPAAGIRLRDVDSPYPVDLFPSLDPLYQQVRDRCVRRPFGPEGRLLPFLSAEDLTVFKLSFGRDKDWVDIGQIVASGPDLDLDYVEALLVGLRGEHVYPRLARLRQLVRQEAG